MKKVLVIGDSYSQPTGFSNVIYGIFKYFDPLEYEIHQLGVNYFGDPHNVPWRLYPAAIKGDLWGFGRIKEMFEKVKPDVVFILNDVWVIDKYLDIIKRDVKEIPPIIAYYPVDSMNLDDEWFRNFDIVSIPVVYTNFGLSETKRVSDKVNPIIIPHGVDNNVFFPIDMPKEEIKKGLYPNKPEFYEDSFIVLNAN